MNQIESSYRRQAMSEEAMGWPSRYGSPDSLDNWRHTRMLDFVKPLLRELPGSSWLTVGDGRYGSDAAYLLQAGASATASSLTDERLRHAHDRGHIKDFRAENAERISLGDGEVDFVLCKEAYHHFPRPPVALYEMLRVARVGAVLIEPMDNPRPFDKLKTLLKRAVRGDGEVFFEPSGNFIYRINVREVGKLMTAMGGLTLAVRPFNDFFHPGLGACDARGWNRGRLLTDLGIAVQDLLCRLRLTGWGLCATVVFKGQADAQLLRALRAAGFQLIELPRNPHA